MQHDFIDAADTSFMNISKYALSSTDFTNYVQEYYMEYPDDTAELDTINSMYNL